MQASLNNEFTQNEVSALLQNLGFMMGYGVLCDVFKDNTIIENQWWLHTQTVDVSSFVDECIFAIANGEQLPRKVLLEWIDECLRHEHGDIDWTLRFRTQVLKMHPCLCLMCWLYLYMNKESFKRAYNKKKKRQGESNDNDNPGTASANAD